MNGIRDRIAYPVSVPPERRGKSARRIRGCRSHPFLMEEKIRSEETRLDAMGPGGPHGAP
jgi:hypothetical protein